MSSELERVCTGCGKTLPISEYYYSKATGYHLSRCKKCTAIYSQERYRAKPKTPPLPTARRLLLAQGFKVCKTCKKVLPLQNFSPKKASCRACLPPKLYTCKKCHTQKPIEQFQSKHTCKECYVEKPTTRNQYWANLFAQGKKRCCSCRQELPLSEFDRKHNGKSTISGYSASCKKCFRAVYQPRAVLYKQRREFLDWILPYLNAEYVCKDCGKILSSWEVKLSGRCAKCQTRSEWLPKMKKRLKKLKGCSKSRLWENIREINRETCKAYLGRSVGNCIGCDKTEFMIHIEKQFQEGMSWDNYGEWTLDHYIPRVYFKDRGELLFVGLHYLNTRPLWMMENSDKGSALPPDIGERIAAIQAYMEAV